MLFDKLKSALSFEVFWYWGSFALTGSTSVDRMIQIWFKICAARVSTKNRDEKVSVWSVKETGKIAALSEELRFEVRSELLELWFSRKVKVDDRVGAEACKQLSLLVSQSLFETIRLRVQIKDRRLKTKAELLLRELGQRLL